MQYQLTNNNTILRVTENETTTIPINEENLDYHEYLKWVELGNKPNPAPIISTTIVPWQTENWAAFSNFLLAELNILTKLQANPLFNALILSLQNTISGFGDKENFVKIWNAENVEYSFTNPEKSKLNKAFKNNHIAIKVSNDGKLIYDSV